jgi:6-phosphogluconolactonase (cycloisomerase 2 family)
VTIEKSLVFVVNAGGAGNISGFRLSEDGELSAIAGSTQPLSGAGTGPAQIEFVPGSRVLVVTEKMTNLILTYLVDRDGVASQPMTHASSGATPFGFAFGKRNLLVVSEAFGGAADASATSSYRVLEGDLAPVSESVATTETAACWVAITNNGRYAYVTNTGSGTVTGYRIQADGVLVRLDDDGETASTGSGSSPIDADFSRNSRFLYVLNAGNQTISVFEVSANGSLTPVETEAGLPRGAVGLAAL